MKKLHLLTMALLMGLVLPGVASAKFESKKNNKVFFRTSYAGLTNSRGGEVFTDTLGTAGKNNGKSGLAVAAGLDLGMMEPSSIMNVASIVGEVSVEYARFSRKNVRRTTSALLAGTTNSGVNVTELNVGIAPKIRFDKWGRFQPYVMPVGLAFLVNSPPSNDSTYLDLGLNFGAGADVKVVDWLSVGIDAKYTMGFESSNTNTSYLTVGGGVGVHF